MNSTTSISRRFAVLAAAGLPALGAAIAFVRSMLARTGGIPSPPLDDTYIYLQYARRLAAGHFLSYCDGAPPSTGASSYLHMGLMVPGWWAGFHGASYVWYALGMGTLYLAVSLAAGAGLAGRLGGSRVSRQMLPRSAAGGPEALPSTPAIPTPTRLDAFWAPAAFLLLVGLNGHFLWASFTGLDTVLYAAGMVLILAGVASRGPRPGWPWILTGSLPLFRPEGIPIGLAGLTILYVAALRQESGAPATPGPRQRAGRALRRLAFALAAALLLFIPAFINWRMTGSPVWDSLRVKSLFAETRPDVLAALIRRLPSVWRDIALLHLNDFRSGSWSVPAGWLLESIMGAGLVAGIAACISGRRGVAGVLTVTWLAAGIVIGGLSPAWHSHYFRYQIPYVPLAAALTVSGWDLLARLVPTGSRPIAKWAIVAAAAILIGPGAVMMRNLYGRNCANINDQQTRVGRWIDANTQPAVRVALNDAGAIAYYGNRQIVDLVGLTTHSFAAANHQGAGALFEKLEAMPERERPQIMAIYPKWYPYLVGTNFTGPSIFSADLTDNTICGDRLKTVYRINWSLAGSGNRPVVREPLIRDFGMNLVDQVDVGDLDSEAAHGYAWGRTFRDRLREFPSAVSGDPGASPVAGPVVEEGGRWISESERMHVRAHPGQWLVVVMRTETELPFHLEVSVNDRPAGRLSGEGLAQMWTEPLVQIPDSLVTDSLLTVDFRWVGDVHGDGYNSYHYWFLQP